MTKTQVCILLVEDDEVDRMACRRALARHPAYEFTIVEAETGRQGIELALAQKPDCVLLDYHWPDLDGLEFLAELRRETGEIPVPVMMLTGADNVGVAVEAMKRGARDYLVKDTNRHYLELLPAVIERVLRERQVLAEKVRTQARLREAEAKYRTLVEQIPAIAYIAALDVPGSLLYISPQIRQLGFSPEEWLADPERLLKQLHPEDRARVREEIAQCYKSGVSLRSEYRLLTRTGEGHWFLDEASLVRDESGEPLFLQGVLVDITRDKEVEEELRWHRRRLEELVAKRTAQLEKQAKLLESANANLTNELGARRRAEQAMRASEERFRLLLESTGEAIYGLDTEGRCNFINEAALKMLGYTRDELLGQLTHERIHHSRADGTPYPAGDCPIYDAFRKGAAVRAGVETLWRKDGSSFPAEYSSYPIRSGERITGAVLVFRDVTESQAMAQQLSHQATHDLLTGLVNRREFERRLTRVLANARADHVDDARDGVGRPRREPAVDDARDGVGTTPGMGEVDRAGSQRSTTPGMASVDRAGSQRSRPRPEHAVDDAALCYLDLDQFKVVNDTCGHAAGDELLRLISALLQEKMRHRDTLARVGGDEFGILLEHCPLDQALRIANELREAVQDFRFVWQGREFLVGVSIGVVALTAATENLASALGAADAACYVAKQKGRNRVHVHEPDDAELAARDAQMQWVSRLTRALDEDRFALCYQPITPLAQHAHERLHYEILLRLVDEGGQQIEPGAFLPAAERYHLMPAIDRWVLRHAVTDYAARHRRTPADELPIYAINISGASLGDADLSGFIRRLLQEYQVPGHALCIEIAETAVIAHLTQATHFIHEIKKLGCLFSLDDFGRGMYSFVHLKTLPVDFLKIDGNFVRSIVEDRLGRAMAEAINQVAHVMAIQTVAECTENGDILGLLKDLGVDHAQGYAIMKPRPLLEMKGHDASRSATMSS